MRERQHLKEKCHTWHNLRILYFIFCITVATKLERSIKAKFDEEIEKIVYKQGNRPRKNDVSLVMCLQDSFAFILSLIFWRTLQKYDHRTYWLSVGIRPHLMLIHFLDFSMALSYGSNEAMLSFARTNCFRDGQGILFTISKNTALTTWRVVKIWGRDWKINSSR